METSGYDPDCQNVSFVFNECAMLCDNHIYESQADDDEMFEEEFKLM